MMAPDIAAVGAAFAEPVHGAQRVFRALLQAMSRPGQSQRLGSDALAGLQPPPAMGRAMCAVLLTLLDADTRVHVGDRAGGGAALHYLRFHCGVPEAAVGEADLVALHAGEVDSRCWDELRDGSDAAPHASATLIVEVAAFIHASPGRSLLLRGPGIRDAQRLTVAGLDDASWQARIAREADFPRGVDLVLTCGDTLAALPRTTRITLD